MSERLPARMRALATELTKLREAAGLTTRQAATRLDQSIATLNRTENARRTATVAEVSAMLAIYGVVGAERKRIMALVDELNTPRWLGIDTDPQRPTLPIFESEAVSIVNFAPCTVPGLLQTPAYARAITSLGQTTELHEAMIAARLDRQKVLARLVAPQYVAILDEAALRRAQGGSAVMVEQINWLIDMAKRPNIALHVIPFRHGGYHNPGYFSLLEFPKAPPIVYVEHSLVSGFLDAPEDTQAFRAHTASLIQASLGCADSVNFLTKMAADHERG
ncbi:helix-turn-helix domain-containing protein [Actinokineospora xionganensis]|uniref:Helix-turn-helix domain-containing protein n=1 Tax=Actinokineospora xionganensis TaxID=2684470 RepID=A0ABR7LF64_9PSEU|nr:helix-turn-helix transcriptional regulator [Actinokineospora xionganensis]MBC6451233.1 helix-turn-helix domain-containing protein [Actinokineospora xionganensis]